MRYSLALLVLAVSLAACGSTSSPASTPTPRFPTAAALGHIVTIPPMTPPPMTRIRDGAKSGAHKLPIRALPTTKPMGLTTPTPLPPSAYTAVLQGSVTDAKTAAPLAGAVITIGMTAPRSAQTGPEGRYRIPFPASAIVPLQVNRRGYAGQLFMGRLRPHQTLTLNFKLNRKIPGHPAPPSPPGIFGKP